MKVQMEPKSHRPRAWLLSAENDYGGRVIPTNVISLKRLSRGVTVRSSREIPSPNASRLGASIPFKAGSDLRRF